MTLGGRAKGENKRGGATGQPFECAQGHVSQQEQKKAGSRTYTLASDASDVSYTIEVLATSDPSTGRTAAARVERSLRVDALKGAGAIGEQKREREKERAPNERRKGRGEKMGARNPNRSALLDLFFHAKRCRC